MRESSKHLIFRLRGLAVLFALILCMAFSVEAKAEKITDLPYTSLQHVREAPVHEGTWTKTSKGNVFKEASGRKLANCWVNINGSIYFLNKAGRPVTGWVRYRKNIYYLNNKGILTKGWVGTCYLLKKTGIRASGFKTISGKTYYFDKTNGRRFTGWKTINGKTYYFTKDGVMKKNCWVKRDGKKYRLGQKGYVLKNQWLTVNGNKYYLSSTGARLFGNHYIDGQWRHFNKYAIYEPDYKFWNTIDPNKPMVALTFDDGPGPYTNRLLDCFERNHGRGTFMMVGSSIGSYPSAVKRMVSLHCELGNHSWSHPAMTTLGNASISSQFSNTSAKIFSVTGRYPTVARLPYGDGHNSSRVLSCIGLPSIYWSIDTMDWANTGNPQHTINAVLNNVKSGDIILMHDIHSSTVTACETIIPELTRRGFQLVTVSELAQYKGKTSLSAGRTYYSFK